MLVYLVRHGQSYNTHPAAHEPMPVNPPLTPVGEAQSRLVASRLQALGVDRLVSSPMRRAIDTARIIGAEVGLPVEVWPRCHEHRRTAGYRCWGAESLRSRYPDLILPSDFAEHDWDYGNESVESGAQRATEFLRWLETETTNSKARRLVVVTHGAFMRLVLGRIVGTEPEGITPVDIENTAVSTLDLSWREFKVLGMNDRSHLASNGRESANPLP